MNDERPINQSAEADAEARAANRSSTGRLLDKHDAQSARDKYDAAARASAAERTSRVGKPQR